MISAAMEQAVTTRMQPITYRLNFNGPAAKTYYPVVARFTDEVLAKAEDSITPMARSYRHYLIKYKLEAPRSVEEYTFELLNLGILWRAYGSVALVDSFVEQNAFKYRWREDRFACLRSRVEYHLNMVGAELMNRAFRREYLATARKTVLVPGCMRIRSAEKCEGTKTPEGIRCSGCESKCRVNQLRQLGLRQNFEVMVIPHSSDLSRRAPKPGRPVIGVVASACLAVLVQGGWELKRYDVPAQCVLLNECGCKKHWHREGFPTQLDIRELKRVMKPSSQAQTVLEMESRNETIG